MTDGTHVHNMVHARNEQTPDGTVVHRKCTDCPHTDQIGPFLA